MKYLSIIIVALLIASCANEKKQEAERAQAMLDEATAAVDARQWQRAIDLLDEMDSTCSKAVDVRRQGMFVKAKAMEGLGLDQLVLNDSTGVMASLRADSLKKLMKLVNNPVGNYYAALGEASDWPLRTHIDAGDGVMSVIVDVAAAKQPFTSVTLTGAGNGTTATSATVAVDGESNRTGDGRQVLTLTGVQCDTLGAYAWANQGGALTMVLDGSGKSVKLTPVQVKALGDMWQYGQSLDAARLAAMRHERLESMIATARSHMARTVNAQ